MDRYAMAIASALISPSMANGESPKLRADAAAATVAIAADHAGVAASRLSAKSLLIPRVLCLRVAMPGRYRRDEFEEWVEDMEMRRVVEAIVRFALVCRPLVNLHAIDPCERRRSSGGRAFRRDDLRACMQTKIGFRHGFLCGIVDPSQTQWGLSGVKNKIGLTCAQSVLIYKCKSDDISSSASDMPPNEWQWRWIALRHPTRQMANETRRDGLRLGASRLAEPFLEI